MTGKQSVGPEQKYSTPKKHNSLDGGLNSAGLRAQTLDAAEANPAAMAEKKMSHVPDEVMHLLSIVDALEAVLSLKRSGRAKHVLFRADKAAVEQASKRDFKVKHLQQLKTLLGDTMELRWVNPHASQRKNQVTASVKDLDLAVRFQAKRATIAPEAGTPPRGRSSTRCQLTASSGSPPRLAKLCPSPQPSPSKGAASLTAGCSSQIRLQVMTSLAKHIVATQKQLLEDVTCLDDMFRHSSWDPSAWVSVKPADLPVRPRQIAVGAPGSLGTTPQRCGSASNTLLTPSPSIRYRNFPSAALPSAQLTPQSMWGMSPAGTHVSPSAFVPGSAADVGAGKHVNVGGTNDPEELADGGTCRVLFPESQTPKKAQSVPRTPLSTCKLTCQTPGKRKRDMSPISPVAEECASEAPGFKTPVATLLATPQKHHRSASKAQRTPGRTCVGLTPTASLTSTQTPVKGGQANQAVRRQLMSLSTPSRYSDRLPIVHVRTPTAKAKSHVSEPSTPINDVNGVHAHCVAATPGAAKPVKQSPALHRRSPAVNLSRAIQFCASPKPPKVANAENFYCSPSKPKTDASTKGSAAFKVISPFSSGLSPHNTSDSLSFRTKKDCAKSDAACLAASIMDDDMAQLLASNSKRAAEQKIAQDPKNIRKVMEKDAMRALPAIYDVIRAAFQKRQSLGIPYEACVTAILDAGLHNKSLSKDAAAVFLDSLLNAVPEWVTVLKQADGETSNRTVSISRMCTGVRQKLEGMALHVQEQRM